MKVKPLADRVLVKPREEKEVYGKYSGTEVTVGGEEYLIMRESDILAVV
jgi:chaperonin GroES